MGGSKAKRRIGPMSLVLLLGSPPVALTLVLPHPPEWPSTSGTSLIDPGLPALSCPTTSVDYRCTDLSYQLRTRLRRHCFPLSNRPLREAATQCALKRRRRRQ